MRSPVRLLDPARFAAVAVLAGGVALALASGASATSGRLAVATTPTGPTIGGQARQGGFLATTLGTVPVGAQPLVRWLRCDAAGADCVAEPDLANLDRGRPSTQPATSENLRYLLSAADVGSTIRSEITAGATVQRSDATTVVASVAGLPSSVALPYVSGPAPPAVTLTASAGTWTNAPTSFAYRWVDCGYADPACGWRTDTSTVPTLRLPWDGNDRSVRVLVTATNAAGSVQALSAPFRYSAPLSVYALPHIGGTAVVGSRLSVTGGAWSGSVVSALGPEEWLRCDPTGSSCVVVASGISGTGYVPTGADVGATLRATLTLLPFGGGGSLHLVTPPTSLVAAATPTGRWRR